MAYGPVLILPMFSDVSCMLLFRLLQFNFDYCEQFLYIYRNGEEFTGYLQIYFLASIGKLFHDFLAAFDVYLNFVLIYSQVFSGNSMTVDYVTYILVFNTIYTIHPSLFYIN